MKVEDYMTRNIITVNADDTIVNAARIMQEADIGILPVEKNEEIVGMLSDRDIVIRAVAAEKDLKSAKIEEIMSHSVICIEKDEEIQEAIDFMAQHKIRRLPVVDKGDLVGIISIGDIANSEFSHEMIGDALQDISEKTLDSRVI